MTPALPAVTVRRRDVFAASINIVLFESVVAVIHLPSGDQLVARGQITPLGPEPIFKPLMARAEGELKTV